MNEPHKKESCRLVYIYFCFIHFSIKFNYRGDMYIIVAFGKEQTGARGATTGK